jgi:hypothetical protein
MIYFVTCPEANAVKIGITSGTPYRLLSRVSTMQTGCPLRLELAAVQDGYLEEEKVLLARFADDRIHGEWFRLTEELQTYIDAQDTPPIVERRPYTLRTRSPRWAA